MQTERCRKRLRSLRDSPPPYAHLKTTDPEFMMLDFHFYLWRRYRYYIAISRSRSRLGKPRWVLQSTRGVNTDPRPMAVSPPACFRYSCRPNTMLRLDCRTPSPFLSPVSVYVPASFFAHSSSSLPRYLRIVSDRRSLVPPRPASSFVIITYYSFLDAPVCSLFGPLADFLV